MRAFSSPLCKS